MPEESTKTEYRTTRRTNRDIDASSVQDWKPGLKPRPMRGYSLSVGQRRTRAMWPTRERGIRSDKWNLPAWHKPYGETLLENDPRILAKLLAATEMAVFERLLELAANEDASDERQDLRRAIDGILALKAGTSQEGSKLSPVGLAGAGIRGMRECVTALGGSSEILSQGKGTKVKVVLPLPEPPIARRGKMA